MYQIITFNTKDCISDIARIISEDRTDPALCFQEYVAEKAATLIYITPEEAEKRMLDKDDDTITYKVMNLTPSLVHGYAIIRCGAYEEFITLIKTPDTANTDRISLYIVSMKVDGRVDVPVLATDPEDARMKAMDKFMTMELNPSNLEVIQYHPVNATDRLGNMTDF